MKNYRLESKITSVNIAKARLHTVLSSDRMQCSSDLIEQMKEDIYNTISKYMEIDKCNFELSITRKNIYIRYTGEK